MTQVVNSPPEVTASQTLSTLISSLCELRRKKKYLESDIKNLDKLIDDCETEIMRVMDHDGVISSKSSIGQVSIDEKVYPQVQSWEQFYEFLHENKYYHLLERRPSVTGYRELITLGRPVPGVLPFTKRKITFKES